MDAVRSLGGEGWFNLGDGDLALPVLRREMLAAGASLADVTRRFASLALPTQQSRTTMPT